MTYHLHVKNSDLKDKVPLAWHVLIKLVGLSMISLFLPAILRHEYGLSLAQIFLLEMCYSTIILLMTHFVSLKFTARYGTVASMLVGVVVFSGNFLVLYFAKFVPWLLVFSPLFSGIYVSFFWIGYHTAMALGSTTSNHFGKDNSFLESVGIVAGLVGPLLGGYLADQFGSSLLYGITILLLLISCVPLFFHQRRHVRSSFTTRHSVHKALQDKSFFKAVVVSFFSLGYMYFVGSVVWVLVLFHYLGTYTKLAVVSAISGVFLIIAFRYVGKRYDATAHVKKDFFPRFLQWTFWSQSGTWVFAGLTLVLGVFSQLLFLFIDTLHKITYKINELSLMNFFYDMVGMRTRLQTILGTLYIREIAIHGTRIVYSGLLALVTYLLGSYQEWGLILALFSVFIIAPLGKQLLIWKYTHARGTKTSLKTKKV